MKKNKINQEENIILDDETKIDDKKKPTAKKIAFSILLILLAVTFVVLGFCVVGGVFDVQTQCNVAYAYDATLPDDGKVGDNILYYSDFSVNFPFSNDEILDDTWRVVSGAAFSYNLDASHTFSSNGSGQLQCFFSEDFSSRMVGLTYTLSLGCSDGIYSSVQSNIALRDYAGLSINTPSGVSLRLRSNNSNRVFVQFYCPNTRNNSSLDIYWVKLECGSNFTGYIRSADDLRDEYDSLSNWRFYYTRDKVVGIVKPFGTGMYEVDGIKHYISKDTNFKVFLVPRTTKISDILNADFTLKLKVKGLNTNDDVVRGVCYNLFDLTGYREYYYICAMASKTPKTRPSEGSTNGCLMYSYDTETKTLYEINPKTFPDVSTEERYLDIVNFYEDFGRNSEQSDFNSTTNGIISVIESPVNFLKDIFNFEIFGINVSAVVFFVLSIVIVAFVIKKVV